MTAEGEYLPQNSQVVRYVPYGKMRRDEEDNILGPYPAAFEEREVDDYLSVAWCEYFVGSGEEQLRCSVESIRNSRMNVKPKACFCVAEVSGLLSAIEPFSSRARAIYHPVEDNQAHAGIYGVSAADAELLSLLADEIWCEYLTKDDADALNLNECQKSDEVQ